MFEKDEEIRSMDIWEVSISRKGNSNARQKSSWDICEMAGGQMVNVKWEKEEWEEKQSGEVARSLPTHKIIGYQKDFFFYFYSTWHGKNWDGIHREVAWSYMGVYKTTLLAVKVKVKSKNSN